MRVRTIVSLVVHFAFIGTIITILLLFASFTTYILLYGDFYFDPDISFISVLTVISVLALLYSTFWLTQNIGITIRIIKSENNCENESENNKLGETDEKD